MSTLESASSTTEKTAFRNIGIVGGGLLGLEVGLVAGAVGAVIGGFVGSKIDQTR